MWNRAFFRTIRVRDGAIEDFVYRGALCVPPRFTQKLDSGPKGIRTPDLMAASHVLYQLSYGPRQTDSLLSPMRPRPSPAT